MDNVEEMDKFLEKYTLKGTEGWKLSSETYSYWTEAKDLMLL